MKVITDELLVALGDQRGKMSVRVWEPEQARETIYCVHGFAGNSADFEYLAPFLAENGYRVVCPDMIGRGKSAYFGDKKFYILESYLRTLGSLFQNYRSETNHLIGNSWGGIIGLVFASIAGMHSGKIILNDPCLKSGGELDALRTRIVDIATTTLDDFDDVVAYLYDAYSLTHSYPRSRIVEIARSKFSEVKGKWRLAIDPAVIEGMRNHIGMDYDVYHHLERLRCPTLLMYGSTSPYHEPERLDPIMARTNHVSCVSDLDGGHAIPLLTSHMALLILGFLETRQRKVD